MRSAQLVQGNVGTFQIQNKRVMYLVLLATLLSLLISRNREHSSQNLP